MSSQRVCDTVIVVTRKLFLIAHHFVGRDFLARQGQWGVVMVVKVRVGPGGRLLGRGRQTVGRQGDEDRNNLKGEFSEQFKQLHLRIEPA